MFLFIVRQSHSGPVQGKTTVKHQDKQHFVFVEDLGEPGNSRTLFLSPKSGEDLDILGTYYGIEGGNRVKLRSRGIVSPLPPSIAIDEGFSWLKPVKESDIAEKIKVRDYHGHCICMCRKVKNENQTIPCFFLEGEARHGPA